MKKYKVIIASAKDVKLLNDKIATDSLFTVGETIINNPLHVGINVVTDKRIIDSVKEFANKRDIAPLKTICRLMMICAVTNMQFAVPIESSRIANISKKNMIC